MTTVTVRLFESLTDTRRELYLDLLTSVAIIYKIALDAAAKRVIS